MQPGTLPRGIHLSTGPPAVHWQTKLDDIFTIPYYEPLRMIAALMANTETVIRWANDITVALDAEWRFTTRSRHQVTLDLEAQVTSRLNKLKLYLTKKVHADDQLRDRTHLFFSGVIPPFEQLTNGFRLDPRASPATSWFREQAANYNYARTSKKWTNIGPAELKLRFGVALEMLKGRVLTEGDKVGKWGVIDLSHFLQACQEWEEAFSAKGDPRNQRYRAALMIRMLKTIRRNLDDVIKAEVVTPRFYYLWIPTKEWVFRSLSEFPPTATGLASATPLSQYHHRGLANSLSHRATPLSGRHRAIYDL